MKTRTSELDGPALGWAVASALKLLEHGYETDGGLFWVKISPNETELFIPWMEWSDMPADIELEIQSVIAARMSDLTVEWEAVTWSGFYGHGPTMLVAMLRAFVRHHYGDEMEAPDELAKN